jgi:hypothetical protein
MTIPYVQYPRLITSKEAPRYTWDGKPVVSVTEIISGIARKEFHRGGGLGERWNPVGFDPTFLHGDDTASLFGQAFHKAGYYTLQDKQIEIPESLVPWIDTFKRFLKEYNVKPLYDKYGNILAEYPLYCESLKYAGTPDLIAQFNHWGKQKRGVAIFDWKTSTSFSKYWRWQLAGYVKPVKDVLFIAGNIYRITVRFDADDYQTEIRNKEQEDFINFQSLVNVWRM